MCLTQHLTHLESSNIREKPEDGDKANNITTTELRYLNKAGKMRLTETQVTASFGMPVSIMHCGIHSLLCLFLGTNS